MNPLDFLSVGAGVADAFGSLWNGYNSKKAYDYQKELNDLQMSREDTAWQRAVEDAEKAGISKAALTGGSSSQALSAGAAPTLKTDFQQRLINNLSVAGMRTQNDIQETALAQAQQEYEDYQQTRLGHIDAENAKNNWIIHNAGAAVAGYPSASEAAVNALLNWLNNGGFKALFSAGKGAGNKVADVVQEVAIAAENAYNTVKEVGAEVKAKQNGTYSKEWHEKNNARINDRYLNEPIDSYERMIGRRAEDYRYGNYISTGGR